MTTKLVPPNIEKGPWFIGTPSTYATYNANKVNAEKVGICEVYGIPLHSTLEEVEKDERWSSGLAHARFLAAAPAMAEALVAVWAAHEASIYHGGAGLKEPLDGIVKSALISAGYRLTTDLE